MYFNNNPIHFEWLQLISLTEEIVYLLRVSNHKSGNHSEVFWLYNRCIHDLIEDDAHNFSVMLLNSII